MRCITLILLLLTSAITSGQKISFSKHILLSTDSDIISVREFWKAYIVAIERSNDSNRGSIYLKYWNHNDLKKGFTDIVKDEFPVYSLGELVILSIEQVPDGFFRIKNKVLTDENSGNNVYAIFNIYVKKEDSGYKLHNYFSLAKPRLQHYKSGNIDFYYPNSYIFNIYKANQIANFYLKYSALYGNFHKYTVTYIIGNSFNEANSFIGFDSCIVSNNSPYAGYTIRNQNIILSCREDNLHEIIHAIFFPMFSHAPSLFDEGVATYYGGSVGKDYTNLIVQLKELINNQPNIDLSDFDTLDKTLENGTNYIYTIGAILIDYAFKKGGPKKVLSLFQYSLKNELDWDDPLPAIKNELGIEKYQIDSFIKNYIKTH